MGFKNKPKVYNITFEEGTDYHGLEVQVGTLTMGQLYSTWTSGDITGAQDAARTFELFMERLVGWNLEDANGPVPTTREAVEAQDDDMVQAAVRQWIRTVMGVPVPLESGSNSGGTSQAESTLTEIPSQSLAS